MNSVEAAAPRCGHVVWQAMRSLGFRDGGSVPSRPSPILVTVSRSTSPTATEDAGDGGGRRLASRRWNRRCSLPSSGSDLGDLGAGPAGRGWHRPGGGTAEGLDLGRVVVGLAGTDLAVIDLYLGAGVDLLGLIDIGHDAGTAGMKAMSASSMWRRPAAARRRQTVKAARCRPASSSTAGAETVDGA